MIILWKTFEHYRHLWFWSGRRQDIRLLWIVAALLIPQRSRNQSLWSRDLANWCSRGTWTLDTSKWQEGRRTCLGQGGTCSHPQRSDPGTDLCKVRMIVVMIIMKSLNNQIQTRASLYLLWLFSLLDILVSHLKVVDILFLGIFWVAEDIQPLWGLIVLSKKTKMIIFSTIHLPTSIIYEYHKWILIKLNVHDMMKCHLEQNMITIKVKLTNLLIVLWSCSVRLSETFIKNQQLQLQHHDTPKYTTAQR